MVARGAELISARRRSTRVSPFPQLIRGIISKTRLGASRGLGEPGKEHGHADYDRFSSRRWWCDRRLRLRNGSGFFGGVMGRPSDGRGPDPAGPDDDPDGLPWQLVDDRFGPRRLSGEAVCDHRFRAAPCLWRASRLARYGDEDRPRAGRAWAPGGRRLLPWRSAAVPLRHSPGRASRSSSDEPERLTMPGTSPVTRTAIAEKPSSSLRPSLRRGRRRRATGRSGSGRSKGRARRCPRRGSGL